MSARRPAPQLRPFQAIAVRPDGLEALWHAIVKCAVDDYRTEAHHTRAYRTAAAWLSGTRILLEDGTVDRHGYPVPTPRKRRRTP